MKNKLKYQLTYAAIAIGTIGALGVVAWAVASSISAIKNIDISFDDAEDNDDDDDDKLWWS